MSCVSSKEKQKITKIHKKEDFIVFKKRNSNNGNLDCQSAWGSLKFTGKAHPLCLFCSRLQRP